MNPEQAADFIGKVKQADGEKLIARDLTFEVLMGEIFRRLNSTDYSEAKRIAEHITASEKRAKELPLPQWVKGNITLYHACFRKFLLSKAHSNQILPPISALPDEAKQVSSGQPPEESASQPEPATAEA